MIIDYVGEKRVMLPSRKDVIQTTFDKIDFYYKALADKSLNLSEVTGISIYLKNITMGMNGSLSFTSPFIDIEKVLQCYSNQGEKEKREVQEIKNKREIYNAVKLYYEFTITRDTAYHTDKYSVSCEYTDRTFKTAGNVDIERTAEKVSRVINRMKNILCDNLALEVRLIQLTTWEKTGLKTYLTLTTSAYHLRDRFDGIGEWVATAIDTAGNIYKITWFTSEEEEETACDWYNPYSIKLIERVTSK